MHAKSEVEANGRRLWPGASVSENSDGAIVSSHGGGAEARVCSGAESTLGLDTGNVGKL